MLKTLSFIWWNLLPGFFRQHLVRSHYNYMSNLLASKNRESDLNLMNYGFASLDSKAKPIKLQDDEEDHRYGIQLYHHMLNASEVKAKDKDILEVGCGRGGGSAFIKRFFKPASINAVDLSPEAIKFCQANYKLPNVNYDIGNAENLDFDDNSFDIVVNVESSHNYNHMDRFLNEVYRTLRPGGLFLITDFRMEDSMENLRQEFRDAGFRIVKEEPIAQNILKACDEDQVRKKSLMDRYVPKKMHRFMNAFSAMQGSAMYTAMNSKSLQYPNFILIKDAK